MYVQVVFETVEDELGFLCIPHECDHLVSAFECLFDEEAARHRVGSEPEKDAVRVNDVHPEEAMLPGCLEVQETYL